MLTANEQSFEARMKHLRAGTRLNSRVKIVVEWTESGQSHREEGITVDVSTKGCLAIVPQGFAVGQRMRLTNKTNGHVADAIVIWRGHEGRTGWELGLELVGAADDYWGVDF